CGGYACGTACHPRRDRRDGLPALHARLRHDDRPDGGPGWGPQPPPHPYRIGRGIKATARLEAPVTVEDQAAAADRSFLEEQIIAYNMARVGAYDGRELAIFVRNKAGGMVAGISGYTWAGFCEIQFLWVDESVRRRGYGSQLLGSAEEEA